MNTSSCACGKCLPVGTGCTVASPKPTNLEIVQQRVKDVAEAAASLEDLVVNQQTKELKMASDAFLELCASRHLSQLRNTKVVFTLTRTGVLGKRGFIGRDDFAAKMKPFLPGITFEINYESTNTWVPIPDVEVVLLYMKFV